eukprot:gene13342-54965_t
MIVGILAAAAAPVVLFTENDSPLLRWPYESRDAARRRVSWMVEQAVAAALRPTSPYVLLERLGPSPADE